MNTCTHIVVDHQRALIFRHQQCNFSHFGCKNASTDIHSRLKVCEVSCFQSFRIPEFFTRWKEGEDSSQDRRLWDDVGNVDTAACSNSVVDACIFPLDHQALQDFSNHQHMSSVQNPEKTRSRGIFLLMCGCHNFCQVSKNLSRLPGNKLDLNLNGKTLSSLQGDASEISGQSSPGV